MMKKHGSDLEDQPLYHVLSKMLRVVAGIDRIIIPGDF
jgi:hypothetical protein